MIEINASELITMSERWLLQIITFLTFVITMHGLAKTRRNIEDFIGVIVESKYARHFECPTCRTRIDIHKRKPCPKCGRELFKIL